MSAGSHFLSWVIRLVLIVAGAVVARRAFEGVRPAHLLQAARRLSGQFAPAGAQPSVRPGRLLPAVGPARLDGADRLAALPAPEAILAALAPTDGMHALVIGMVQRYVAPLARAVGPTGRVQAVGGGPALLDHVEADLWREGLTNVRLWPGVATRLPLADRSIDRALWVVEPLVEPPDAALAELRRVLRPAGQALLIVPSEEHAGAITTAAKQATFQIQSRQGTLITLARRGE